MSIFNAISIFFFTKKKKMKRIQFVKLNNLPRKYIIACWILVSGCADEPNCQFFFVVVPSIIGICTKQPANWRRESPSWFEPSPTSALIIVLIEICTVVPSETPQIAVLVSYERDFAICPDLFHSN